MQSPPTFRGTAALILTISLLAAAALGVATLQPRASVPAERPVLGIVGGSEFRLALALDEESQFRGFAGRTSIKPDEGIAFVFASPQFASFTMRDCTLPLDLIFFDDALRITGIHEMTPELPRGPGESSQVPEQDARYEARLRSYMSDQPVRGAIELPGGTAARFDLRIGDQFSCPPIRDLIDRNP